MRARIRLELSVFLVMLAAFALGGCASGTPLGPSEEAEDDAATVADHVQLLRREYRVKRDAMLEAADEVLAPIAGVRWRKPAGGLYIWVELPDAVDAGPDGELFGAALEEDVLYVPGQFCL